MSYETDLAYRMALDARLGALEVEGDCRCPHQAHIWYENCPRWKGCHDHHSPPPARCETCGRQIVALQITYVDDWRGVRGEV